MKQPDFKPTEEELLMEQQNVKVSQIDWFTGQEIIIPDDSWPDDIDEE